MSNKDNSKELTPGQKRAITIRERYGDDFYSRMSKKVVNRSAHRPFRDVPGAALKAVRARFGSDDGKPSEKVE